MLGRRRGLVLNQYDYGVIFHSLNDTRNQMLKDEQPTDTVDDVLLKVIHLIDHPKKRGIRQHEER